MTFSIGSVLMVLLYIFMKKADASLRLVTVLVVVINYADSIFEERICLFPVIAYI